MMLPQHVRFVLPGDYHDLAKIDAMRTDGVPPATEDALRCLIRDDHHVMALVYDTGEGPSAFALYHFAPASFGLLNLSVWPGSRRRGIGSLLVSVLRDRLVDGRECISSIVSERNLPMQKFLAANGFIASRVSRDAFGPGHDGYLFTLLAKPAACHRVLIAGGQA